MSLAARWSPEQSEHIGVRLAVVGESLASVSFSARPPPLLWPKLRQTLVVIKRDITCEFKATSGNARAAIRVCVRARAQSHGRRNTVAE